MNIASVHARQILDSRGNPTIEVDITLENGLMARAAVPSGASTGTNEAVELRDGDPKRFGGKGVSQAIANVNDVIAPKLAGRNIAVQREIDRFLCELDGTSNKSKLGANAILAVSLVAAKAAALATNVPLYQYFASLRTYDAPVTLPVPQMNIINGGKHAANATDIQEFMIMPIGAPSFSEAVRMGSEIFHALGKVLKQEGYSTTVGDEGGYAPKVRKGNQEALELIAAAVTDAGYALGKDVMLALDAAASEFRDENGNYVLKAEQRSLSSPDMVDWLVQLTAKYPVASVEDGLAEDDWPAWAEFTKRIGDKVQVVGDDLLVTNVKFLQRGIDEKSANAILIKLNQIGTVTETIDAVELAHRAGWRAVISHRSGETEDTSIAHLAVGLGTGQIKAGSLSRTDRVAKYNELLRIEEMLGADAAYAGKQALGRA